ncbi:MAG: hypothetical protein VKJ24_11095 [Synechococcales bacterium]|nr:hypothetical protein [Synechococcales bacterium]
MAATKLFTSIINFFSDAVSRIFGLVDDDFPETGVQPYSGDIQPKHDKHAKAN